MAKMYFAKTVKYLGVKYAPHIQFEVDDKDIESLRQAGGWVVEELKSEPVEDVIEPVEVKAEADASEPVEPPEPEVVEPKIEAPKKAPVKPTSTKKVA